jgi:hypothetical protein
VQTQFAERPSRGVNPRVTTVFPDAAPKAEEAAKAEGAAKVKAGENKRMNRLNALLRGERDPGPEGRKKPNEAEPKAADAEHPHVQSGANQPDGAIQLVAFDEKTMIFTLTTANMIRTAPLWGLRTRPQLLHDGSALTLRDAINAHHGQTDRIRRAFEALTKPEQEDLLAFLGSL